jgi:hypothetical protein
MPVIVMRYYCRQTEDRHEEGRKHAPLPVGPGLLVSRRTMLPVHNRFESSQHLFSRRPFVNFGGSPSGVFTISRSAGSEPIGMCRAPAVALSTVVSRSRQPNQACCSFLLDPQAHALGSDRDALQPFRTS